VTDIASEAVVKTYDTPTELLNAMEGAHVEKFDAPPAEPEDDWRIEYRELQTTSVNINGQARVLDTFKEADALVKCVEPYGDDDAEYLDAVAKLMSDRFGGEYTWGQATRYYRLITERSARLKKTVETSLASSDFTI
jgi:hypothetical protein